MADLNFPLNPQVNDYYTANGRTFKYDGSKWRYTTLSIVTLISGSALTSVNGLTNSAQDFLVGISGNTFNISSSGNTHTFNIPYAGSATTGLINYQAQTIAGSKTFSSAIIGNLTGTATTSSYSLQSGYGITAGLATTASNINVNSASTNSSHFLIFSPTVTGSGVALSSESALVYNPLTDILSVSGLAITAGTASTSTFNGALQVAGGVGISGRLVFNQSSFGTTGIATNPSMAMIGQTGDPIFMTVLEDNSISFEGTQGQLFSITPNLSSGYIYSVNDITGIPLIRANANANVTANEYAGNFGIGLTNPGYKLHVLGSVGFTSTTASTSTATGTLVVGGGVGIGGSLYVASATAISGVTINAGVITGSLTGTATTAGFATTSSYSLQSGYGVTAGLATTAQTLNTVAASTNATHYVLFTPVNGGSGVAVSSDSGLTFNPSSNTVSLSTLAATTVSTSTASITGSTASTSSTTGALVVTGGVGIGGSLYVAGDLTINGTTTTINTVTLTVDDKNIELGSVTSPSDVTAEAGGITLKGATDKLINWYTGTGWSSSESWNLATGNTYKINNTTVLSNSSIGTGITNSSLTALGTITTGVWAGTTITAHYGGTGLQTTFTVGDLLYANTSTTWARLAANSNSGYILASAGTGATPVYTNPASITVGTATTATNINAVLATTNASHPLLFTPTSGSVSGLAVSSNTTLVYNPSTDILSVSGMAVTSATNSTSSSTGALIVTGGVGIGQSASVGGRLQMFNGANYTAFVSSATGNTVYTLPATSPATGSSVLQSTSAGVMSWVPMVASSSGATSANVNIVAAGSSNLTHSILFTPSASSSGSAISSDSTISFNPSTEILSVSGLAITSGTASTNTTTGALIVRGGLGVTGQLSFATASFGFTGIATNPSMSFIGATTSSPITLTVLTDNSLNWEGSQGSVFSIDSNLSSGEIFSVSDISGLPIISASAGQTVNINEFGGYTQIGNGSINSSSTSNGSLVIAGGLGMTGNAFIGGTTTITNLTSSSSVSSGSLVLNGGLGISGNAFIGGTTTVTNLTSSSSVSSGSLVIRGGIGISGNAFIGGTVNITNATSPSYGSTTSGALVIAGGVGIGGTVYIGGQLGVGGTLDYNAAGNVSYFAGNVNSYNQVIVHNHNPGSSASSDFIVSNDSTTDTTYFGDFGMNSSGWAATTSAYNSANAVYLASNSGDLAIGSLTTNPIRFFYNNGVTDAVIFGGTAATVNYGTNAASITSGALQVKGGLGITGNAFIGGTTTITSTSASASTASGALVVSGGVGIGQSLFVGGSISNANYFYSGGNNFVKSGQAQGDIFLDNNANDTPGVLYYYKNNTNFGTDVFATGTGSTRYRIVKDLNESGGSELWSIDRTGVVTQTAWAPGEIIKMTVLVGADLTGGSTTTISTTSDTDVASYSYTPVSSNSYLVIEFTTRYFVVGAAADDYVSRIAVDGAEQSYNVQVWTNGAGGGTRSGTLFPLMARYTNSNTTAKTISATVRRGTTDDNATVYKDTTTVMKITEIGR